MCVRARVPLSQCISRSKLEMEIITIIKCILFLVIVKNISKQIIYYHIAWLNDCLS